MASLLGESTALCASLPSSDAGSGEIATSPASSSSLSAQQSSPASRPSIPSYSSAAAAPPDPSRFAGIAFRDVFWAVLFHVHTVGVIVAAALAPAGARVGLPPHSWTILFTSIGVALITAGAWLLCARRLGAVLVWVVLGAASVALTTVLICYFSIAAVRDGKEFYLFAIAVGIALLCSVSLGIAMRDRVDFAHAIVETGVQFMRRYPASLAVAAGATLVKAAWFIVWYLAAAGTLHRMYDRGDTAPSVMVVTAIASLVSLHWSSQAVSGVLHVTVAGSFASWYFLYPTHAPERPTLGALKRALTTSFGSIALGSMATALVQNVRRLIHHARQCDVCGRTCAASDQCVEAPVFHLNDHAFTYVAIYSRSYADSARDVHQLFVLNGVDEAVHDDLTSIVLGAAAFASGAVTALVAFLSSISLGDVDLAPMHAISGFLIGALCTGCSLEIVSACSAALYVCFTEDPSVFRANKPSHYEVLVAAWRRRFGTLHVGTGLSRA